MGLGIVRGSGAPKVVDSAGVIKVVERRRNRRARVIMVCREAWSALASSSRGVSFRWTGRSARLDSHLWDAG
jgi:hypothetical protein